jgi:hypothetical protein
MAKSMLEYDVRPPAHIQLGPELIVHRERILEARRLAADVVFVRVAPLGGELTDHHLRDPNGQLWLELQMMATTCCIIHPG